VRGKVPMAELSAFFGRAFHESTEADAAWGVHIGPYDTIAQSYTKQQTWMAAQGHGPATEMWECYLSDPKVDPDPATWRTRIVCPLARGHPPSLRRADRFRGALGDERLPLLRGELALGELAGLRDQTCRIQLPRQRLHVPIGSEATAAA
jgi:hypothetical protein